MRLAYRPPYDWASLSDFLAARALPGVERVDCRGYARVIVLPAGPAVIRVCPVPGRSELELTAHGALAEAHCLLRKTAERVFDLATDPALPASAFEHDPLLAPLVHRRPGLRIPGAWDAFECAVRAVIGQQVSVAAARTFAGRLVERAGQKLPTGIDGLTHLFPTPQALAHADLRGIGLIGARIASIQNLARAVVQGRLDFSASTAEVLATLDTLPGIGAWTAQYVALRALGEPDAFPAADIVLRRAAAVGSSPLTASALGRRADTWRPWRSHAVVHLWRAAGEPIRSAGARMEGSRDRDLLA